MYSINQGSNEDDSQSNPHPEAGLPTSGREDRHHMATGVQRERVWMVATEILMLQKAINVYGVRCRIDASLMFLMITLMNHQCYQCVPDVGVQLEVLPLQNFPEMP